MTPMSWVSTMCPSLVLSYCISTWLAPSGPTGTISRPPGFSSFSSCSTQKSQSAEAKRPHTDNGNRQRCEGHDRSFQWFPRFLQGHPAQPVLPPWARWLRPLPRGSHRTEPPRGIPACRLQLQRENTQGRLWLSKQLKAPTQTGRTWRSRAKGKIPGIAGSSPTSFTRPELSSVGSSSWTFRMDSCTSSLMCSTPTAFPVGPVWKEHQSNT